MTKDLNSRGINLPVEERDMKNLLYTLFKRNVERRKNDFVLTNELKENILQVSDFLISETRKYGLFMPGSVGNGKTTMLRTIRDVLFQLVERGVVVTSEGDKYPRYLTARQLVESARDVTDFRSIKATKFLLLDDVGEEATEVMVYGNFAYPFVDVIEYRYEMMLPTFISSNLAAKDFAQKYNNLRVTDRMNEMFKVVSFKGGSFR